MKKGYYVSTNGGIFQELHMNLHREYLEYFKGVLFLI